MHNVFDADDGGVPFFSSLIEPEALLAVSAVHSEAHVPGRHLNALLSAEDAIGAAVDEAAIGNHRRAAFLSYSGPVALPLNRETKDGAPINFCAHNLREGFHALYALARFRDDREARELAENSSAAIGQLWDADDRWDLPALEPVSYTHLTLPTNREV